MSSECIEWPRAKTRSGYGVKWSRKHGKVRYVHRVIFEVVHGVTLGRNDFICHRCDNPSCINVDHLFLGDDRVNHDDMVAKGRQARGFALPHTRLTDEQCLDIVRRVRAGESQSNVARSVGISPSYVSQLVNGKRRAR